MDIIKITEDAVVPVRSTERAAGFDLAAGEDVVVPAGGRAIIGTGWEISIPDGTYARIAPRSGLAVKNEIQVGAGVVDADYRGEMKVVLFNQSKEDFTVSI